MDDTPNLNLPLVAAAQAQKHVTHNEALVVLDALVQLSVETASLVAPPSAPENGHRCIVAAGASGTWAGKDGLVAARLDGAWSFFAAREGWLAWVADEDMLRVYDGTTWKPCANGLVSVNPASLVGVATVADATNRLAVKSDAVLFSHDDVTPGSGSVRHKLNKAAASNTASVLLQDGWSGRAEMGLAGDDDFRVKVSADGSVWYDGLVVDRHSGRVTFPNSRYRETLSAGRTYYLRPDGNDANDGRSDSATGAFLTLSGACSKIAATIDGGGYDVTLSLAAGTYAPIVTASPLVGVRELKIVGKTGIPADVAISGSNYIDAALTISFSAVSLTAPATTAISIKTGTLRIRSGVVFEAASIHIWLRDRAVCYVDNDYAITGGATQHIRMDVQSFFSANGRTTTLTGTPAFTHFIFAQQGAIASFYACAFSGSATGTRYNVTKNALVDTSGAGASFLPGNAAGITSSGGSYT